MLQIPLAEIGAGIERLYAHLAHISRQPSLANIHVILVLQHYANSPASKARIGCPNSVNGILDLNF